MTDLDDHGQPLIRFRKAADTDRDIAELLGFAKGVLSDGIVSPYEVDGLAAWVNSHTELLRTWPVSAVYERLRRVLEDGKVDDDERDDLAELLRQLVGGESGIVDGQTASTELPLDQPPPKIEWSGSVFVFTGKLASGSRKACQERVVARGGIAENAVTRRTRYLVLGPFASRAWANTSYGRKIEAAVELRAEGRPISIVSEEHWAGSLT